MFEDLNIRFDIERYSPDTRQAIQDHQSRVDDLRAMLRAIQLLELAERELKACGQYAHCEAVTWTADKMDEVQYDARQVIKSKGHDLQQQIWRENLAIDSADYKEAQA